MRGVFAAAIAAVATAFAWAFLAQAKELSLTIADLETAAISARSLRLTLSGEGLRQLTIDIDRLALAGRDFRRLRLTCADFTTTAERITCTRGVLHLVQNIPVSFTYGTRDGKLAAEFRASPNETWRIAGRVAGAQSALRVTVENGDLTRVASWMPRPGSKITSGTVNGTVDIEGTRIKARVQIEQLAFSDSSGLHAGEKIGGTIEAVASHDAADWRWHVSAAWQAGEVFWDPMFLSGTGQRVQLDAVTSATRTNVLDSALEIPNVGSVAVRAEVDHASGKVEKMQARSSRLRVPALYEQLLKPLLQQTSASDLRAQGEATFAIAMASDTITSVDLELHDVSVEDGLHKRFALSRVSGRIPWRRDEPTTGELVFKGAEVLKLPIGEMRIPFRLRNSAIAVANVRLPILDGALQLRDFAAGIVDEGWRWRFSGQLEPISMALLTRAIGMPEMYGALSGVIPEVRYRRQTLTMDGALVIAVFDGTVNASSVQFIEPFGRAPRLHADIEMKNVDLELLTRAFDFGTITGRLDAQVNGLELVDWQPVRFDARLESSRGNYPRRISQRAVENISALGGAGAAAAIQRSFLRFFDQFGYQSIGLTCRLNNGVCEMDGIERAPQGYVIVKGGGIPAISVIGYNRHVSWRELVDRLKRITQDNVKPVVK